MNNIEAVAKADIFPSEEIWEQCQNEPTEAYNLFVQFLQLKPRRSLSKLSQKTGVSFEVLNKYKTEFLWEQRAIAYDKYLLELERQEQENIIKEVCLRHAKQAETLQKLLLLPAQALAKKLEEGSIEDLNKASTEELLQHLYKVASLLKPLVEVERLSRGLSTENISNQTSEKVEIIITPATPDADSNTSN